MTRLRHKKYNLEEIARRIESARESPIGQPGAFRAFEIEDIQSILESGIDFQPQVAEVDRGNVIWTAMSTAAQADIVSAASLMQHLQQAENEYLRQQVQDYVLATSITIRYFDQLTRMQIDNATITMSRNLPRNFKRDSIQGQLQRIGLEQPERLTSVRIHVKARTVASAAEQALWTFDILRGLWNYSINRRIRIGHRWGGGRERPINEILLGPIHTLHRTSGALATENFWYESRY